MLVYSAVDDLEADVHQSVPYSASKIRMLSHST